MTKTTRKVVTGLTLRARTWDESKHPRDDAGRFARKGMGGRRWISRVLSQMRTGDLPNMAASTSKADVDRFFNVAAGAAPHPRLKPPTRPSPPPARAAAKPAAAGGGRAVRYGSSAEAAEAAARIPDDDLRAPALDRAAYASGVRSLRRLAAGAHSDVQRRKAAEQLLVARERTSQGGDADPVARQLRGMIDRWGGEGTAERGEVARAAARPAGPAPVTIERPEQMSWGKSRNVLPQAMGGRGVETPQPLASVIDRLPGSGQSGRVAEQTETESVLSTEELDRLRASLGRFPDERARPTGQRSTWSSPSRLGKYDAQYGDTARSIARRWMDAVESGDDVETTGYAVKLIQFLQRNHPEEQALRASLARATDTINERMKTRKFTAIHRKRGGVFETLTPEEVGALQFHKRAGLIDTPEAAEKRLVEYRRSGTVLPPSRIDTDEGVADNPEYDAALKALSEPAVPEHPDRARLRPLAQQQWDRERSTFEGRSRAWLLKQVKAGGVDVPRGAPDDDIRDALTRGAILDKINERPPGFSPGQDADLKEELRKHATEALNRGSGDYIGRLADVGRLYEQHRESAKTGTPPALAVRAAERVAERDGFDVRKESGQDRVRELLQMPARPTGDREEVLARELGFGDLVTIDGNTVSVASIIEHDGGKVSITAIGSGEYEIPGDRKLKAVLAERRGLAGLTRGVRRDARLAEEAHQARVDAAWSTMRNAPSVYEPLADGRPSALEVYRTAGYSKHSDRWKLGRTIDAPVGHSNELISDVGYMDDITVRAALYNPPGPGKPYRAEIFDYSDGRQIETFESMDLKEIVGKLDKIFSRDSGGPMARAEGVEARFEVRSEKTGAVRHRVWRVTNKGEERQLTAMSDRREAERYAEKLGVAEAKRLGRPDSTDTAWGRVSTGGVAGASTEDLKLAATKPGMPAGKLREIETELRRRAGGLPAGGKTPETSAADSKSLAALAGIHTYDTLKADGFKRGVEVREGDVAAVHSRGETRQGVVTKVTPTRVEVSYTTRGAINENPGNPRVTRKTVNREEVWIKAAGREKVALASAGSGRVQNPAKRGDLVLVERKRSAYVQGKGREERTEYEFGRVASVDREGKVKTFVGTSGSTKKVEPGQRALVSKAEAIDVDAVMEAARQHTYPQSDTPMPFASIEDAVKLARPHAADKARIAAKLEAKRASEPRNRKAASLKPGDRILYKHPRGRGEVELDIIGEPREVDGAIKVRARNSKANKEGDLTFKRGGMAKVIPAGGETTPAPKPPGVDPMKLVIGDVIDHEGKPATVTGHAFAERVGVGNWTKVPVQLEDGTEQTITYRRSENVTRLQKAAPMPPPSTTTPTFVNTAPARPGDLAMVTRTTTTGTGNIQTRQSTMILEVAAVDANGQPTKMRPIEPGSMTYTIEGLPAIMGGGGLSVNVLPRKSLDPNQARDIIRAHRGEYGQSVEPWNGEADAMKSLRPALLKPGETPAPVEMRHRPGETRYDPNEPEHGVTEADMFKRLQREAMAEYDEPPAPAPQPPAPTPKPAVRKPTMGKKAARDLKPGDRFTRSTGEEVETVKTEHGTVGEKKVTRVTFRRDDGTEGRLLLERSTGVPIASTRVSRGEADTVDTTTPDPAAAAALAAIQDNPQWRSGNLTLGGALTQALTGETGAINLRGPSAEQEKSLDRAIKTIADELGRGGPDDVYELGSDEVTPEVIKRALARITTGRSVVKPSTAPAPPAAPGHVQQVIDNGTSFTGNPRIKLDAISALSDAEFAGLTSEQQDNVRFVLAKLSAREDVGPDARRLQRRFGEWGGSAGGVAPTSRVVGVTEAARNDPNLIKLRRARIDKPQEVEGAHGVTINPGDRVTMSSDLHNRTGEQGVALDVGVGEKGGSALTTVRWGDGTIEQVLTPNLVKDEAGSAERVYAGILADELASDPRARKVLRGQPSTMDKIMSPEFTAGNFRYKAALLRREAVRHRGTPLADKLTAAQGIIERLGSGNGEPGVIDRLIGRAPLSSKGWAKDREPAGARLARERGITPDQQMLNTDIVKSRGKWSVRMRDETGRSVGSKDFATKREAEAWVVDAQATRTRIAAAQAEDVKRHQAQAADLLGGEPELVPSGELRPGNRFVYATSIARPSETGPEVFTVAENRGTAITTTSRDAFPVTGGEHSMVYRVAGEPPAPATPENVAAAHKDLVDSVISVARREDALDQIAADVTETTKRDLRKRLDLVFDGDRIADRAATLSGEIARSEAIEADKKRALAELRQISRDAVETPARRKAAEELAARVNALRVPDVAAQRRELTGLQADIGSLELFGERRRDAARQVGVDEIRKQARADAEADLAELFGNRDYKRTLEQFGQQVAVDEYIRQRELVATREYQRDEARRQAKDSADVVAVMRSEQGRAAAVAWQQSDEGDIRARGEEAEIAGYQADNARAGLVGEALRRKSAAEATERRRETEAARRVAEASPAELDAWESRRVELELDEAFRALRSVDPDGVLKKEIARRRRAAKVPAESSMKKLPHEKYEFARNAGLAIANEVAAPAIAQRQRTLISLVEGKLADPTLRPATREKLTKTLEGYRKGYIPGRPEIAPVTDADVAEFTARREMYMEAWHAANMASPGRTGVGFPEEQLDGLTRVEKRLVLDLDSTIGHDAALRMLAWLRDRRK